MDFSTDLRQQPAPYVPKITHSTDTSNFDPVDPEKLWSSDDNDGDNGDGNHNDDTLSCWFRNGKHPEHAFYEFTFRRFFDDNGYPYSCPKPIEYEEEGYEGEEGEAEASGQEVAEDCQGAQAASGRDLVYV